MSCSYSFRDPYSTWLHFNLLDDYVSELGSGPSIVEIRTGDRAELDLFIFNVFKYSFPTVDRLSFLTVEGLSFGLSVWVLGGALSVLAGSHEDDWSLKL